jgi:head-tail adaptor
MPAIGAMRARVTFEVKTEQDGPGGGVRSAWVRQFTRWARVIPQRGGEEVQAQRLAGVQPVLIIVRNDSDTQKITPDWRAVETVRGGKKRYYALKTAEDMERCGEFITCQAVAGAADGA